MDMNVEDMYLSQMNKEIYKKICPNIIISD